MSTGLRALATGNSALDAQPSGPPPPRGSEEVDWGVGWRVTYEPHPKRRFKAPPFASLGSLITDNSETSD